MVCVDCALGDEPVVSLDGDDLGMSNRSWERRRWAMRVVVGDGDEMRLN